MQSFTESPRARTRGRGLSVARWTHGPLGGDSTNCSTSRGGVASCVGRGRSGDGPRPTSFSELLGLVVSHRSRRVERSSPDDAEDAIDRWSPGLMGAIPCTGANRNQYLADPGGNGAPERVASKE